MVSLGLSIGRLVSKLVSICWFVPACRDWLRMRNISLKVLFLFMATAIFVAPLVASGDKFCLCPDCAEGTCLVKSEDCPGVLRSEEVSPCCDQGETISETTGAEQYSAADSNAAESDHKSQTKSKDCRCCIVLCYDGHALMPVADSILSSAADDFYQRMPKAFVTSGWVHQILHPPQ